MAKNARIKIVAEDKTKKGTESARKNLEELKKSAKGAAVAIAAVGVATGGALIARQAEAIRMQSRMARQLDITTESLQKLSYVVSSEAEISQEQFNDILQEFQVRLGDAQAGTGALIDAFSQLGLSVDDVVKLKADEAFLRVADAIASLSDNTRDQFLLEEIFAGESAKLAIVMRQGAQAIREKSEELEKFGGLYSDEEAQKVEKFHKEINTLKERIKALGNQAVIFMAGDFVSWIKSLTDGTGEFSKVIQKLAINFKIFRLEQKLHYAKVPEYITQIKGMIATYEVLRDKLEETNEPLTVTVTSGQNPSPYTVPGQDADSMLIERQQFLLEQAEFGAQRFLEIWGSTFETFEQGVGDAFATAIVEQESLGDGLQLVMRQVAKSVISTLVQLGVQQITNILKVKGMQSSANTALLGELHAINMAATPAAIATNIATAGAAGISAATTGTAAATAMKSAMLLGQFHDGIDFVPKTGSYLLEKGERVIPAKDNNKGMLSGPSFNISISAIDSQSGFEFLMKNEGRIIDMIQRAYDVRGKSGGPSR